MPVAAPEELSPATVQESGLGSSLRVESDQLRPVRGYIGDKPDVVLPGHGMGQGDKQLIFHGFHLGKVRLLRLLRLQCRQGNAAAGNHGFSGGPQHIAADRADIKPGPQNIGALVLVADGLPGEQFGYGEAKTFRQGLQKADVRKPPAGIT